MVRHLIQAVSAALALAGGTPGAIEVGPSEGEMQTIYLVRFGWHADLLVPNEPCQPLPDIAPADLRATEYVAIGWGDAGYFPRRSPGIAATLRAALFPTPSVYRAMAVSGSTDRRYRGFRMLELEMAEADCRRLGDFIRDGFAVTDSALVAVESDRPGTSARYFLSTERYHLLHNCNHWTAEALRAGGMPMRPILVPTVELLWQEARKYGEMAR